VLTVKVSASFRHEYSLSFPVAGVLRFHRLQSLSFLAICGTDEHTLVTGTSCSSLKKKNIQKEKKTLKKVGPPYRWTRLCCFLTPCQTLALFLIRLSHAAILVLSKPR